nr:hypothetical protein [Tanacetum cinerariifolium]
MREVLSSSLAVRVFLQERKKEWGLSPKAKVSPILGFFSISLVIVSGQSGTLVGQGSAYNRGCCLANTDCLPRMCCGSALSASILKHPGRNQLISGLSGSSEATICGKSPSALKELLASSQLNVEVGIAALLTLPMVNSSVSATLEHESGTLADSITGPNVRTAGASERFVISLDSSHHSSTHASDAEEMGVKVTSPVHASLFQDFDSTKTVKANTAEPSYSANQDLSMGSRELNSETLRQVFVPQRNVLNDSLLDDYDVSYEFIDHLAPPVLVQTEYCLSERKRLESECEKQADLLKLRDVEIESLKAQFLLKETKAADAVHLRARVSASKVTEKKHASEIDALKQKNVALENEKGSLDGKVVELQSLVSTKDLELKELNDVHELEVTCSSLREQLFEYENLTDRLEEFQDAQLKVVNDKLEVAPGPWLEARTRQMLKFIRRLLLAHGLKLVLVKCLNSFEYLMALGAAISRSIEKGMQDEADFNYALQELRELDYPLIAELKSHKDASVEDIMNLLRLEGRLADAPAMGDLQPDIEQLKVPIHRSEDQVVLGETFLSFALSVSHSCVEQIRANIAVERSILLSEPLFV